MFGVLHVRTLDRDVRPDGWNSRVVSESRACHERIGLCDWIATDDLEHEIPSLIRVIAAIEQLREWRVDPEPTVRVAITLVTHAVGSMSGLIRGGVDNHTGDCDAILLDEESFGFVDVHP